MGTSLAIAKRLAKATKNTATLNRAITDFKDEAGESLCVNLDGPVARVLIIGGADSAARASTANCRAGRAKVERLEYYSGSRAPVGHQNQRPRRCLKAQTLMQAISHASYRFNAYKSKPKQPVSLKRVRLLANAGDQSAARCD